MPVFSDFLLKAGIAALPNTWVKLVNNITGTVFISTALSDSNGLFTFSPTVPPGSYSLYVGPSSTGPWPVTPNDPNYTVPFTPSDPIYDNGGMVYSVMNPNVGPLKGDGTDESAKLKLIYSTTVPVGCVIYYPTPPVNYGIADSITPRANQVSRGPNKFSCTIRRANTTNKKMFACEGVSGLVFETLGFDPNSANQTLNHEGLRFDNAANNNLVRSCNFLNVQGFAVFNFGGPTGRNLNFRLLDSDCTTLVGATTDVFVPLSEGGETTDNRINGQAQVCFNIYESNNHSVIGNSAQLNGVSGVGFAFSSSQACPGVGNVVKLGVNDTGFTVIKELDNSNARPQLQQSLTNNWVTGTAGAPAGVGIALQNASNTSVQGGALRDLAQGMQFNSGNVGVEVADVPFIDVVTPWAGALPPFTYFHHCPGLTHGGQLAAVTVPAAGVDIINNNGMDGWYYVAGGQLSGLYVGFQAPVILFLTTSPTGGTLAGGTTRAYRVSMVDNAGGETLAGPEVTIAIPAGTNTNTVTVTWYQPTGWIRAGSQPSFRVYGRGVGAELLMVSNLLRNFWVDDGSVTPAGALPTTNQSARNTGMTSGPIFVGAYETLQWQGQVAPASIVARGVN